MTNGSIGHHHLRRSVAPRVSVHHGGAGGLVAQWRQDLQPVVGQDAAAVAGGEGRQPEGAGQGRGLPPARGAAAGLPLPGRLAARAHVRGRQLRGGHGRVPALRQGVRRARPESQVRARAGRRGGAARGAVRRLRQAGLPAGRPLCGLPRALRHALQHAHPQVWEGYDLPQRELRAVRGGLGLGRVPHQPGPGPLRGPARAAVAGLGRQRGAAQPDPPAAGRRLRGRRGRDVRLEEPAARGQPRHRRALRRVQVGQAAPSVGAQVRRRRTHLRRRHVRGPVPAVRPALVAPAAGEEPPVISSDAKVIKIWDRRDGSVFTNVETPAEVKDVCVVEGAQGKSGVLLVAGEQERVMELLHPRAGNRSQVVLILGLAHGGARGGGAGHGVRRLPLRHACGDRVLRTGPFGGHAAAQGAVAEPFAYDEWRKKKLKEKVEAKQANRITIQRRLPKVNRATAERILQNEAKRKKNSKGADGDEADAGSSFSNPLGDERFSRMFTSTDFEVDEESDTYRMLHPNAANTKQQRKKEDMDSDAGSDDDDDEDDDVGDRFSRVEDDEEEAEIEGRPSDESSDEEEDEVPQRAPQRTAAAKGKRKPAPKFYEIAEGEKVGDLISI
ncbi:hypothetical protein ON010_g17751 [Phytophthora cinnamomi]|nr:hypothetical protein ON010_g17751 [Phytophthora cinnamomi]